MTGHQYQLQGLASNVYQSSNAESRACLVFTMQSASARPRQYQGVMLEFLAECEMRIGRSRTVKPCAVLHCRAVEFEPRFQAVVEEASRVAANNPDAFRTDDDVSDFVQGFAELFDLAPRLGPEAELGLWGELSFLLSLKNIEAGVEAWHGPSRHVVDFARNNVEIEVKTAVGGHVHRFRHAQTGAALNTQSNRYILSTVAARDPAGGQSLDELVAKIRARLPRRVEFERKLFRCGYSENVEYAQKWSLQQSMVIPQSQLPPVGPFPDRVLRAEYDLRLDGLPALPSRAWSQLQDQLTFR